MKNLADLMNLADTLTSKAAPTPKQQETKAEAPSETKAAEPSQDKAAEQEQTKAAEPSQKKTATMEELTEEQKNALLSNFDNLKKLGLTITLNKTWVWISGDTKPHKEEIKKLNISGYKYGFSKSKSQWYFSPLGYRKKTRRTWSKEEIKEKFGSIEL